MYLEDGTQVNVTFSYAQAKRQSAGLFSVCRNIAPCGFSRWSSLNEMMRDAEVRYLLAELAVESNELILPVFVTLPQRNIGWCTDSDGTKRETNTFTVTLYIGRRANGDFVVLLKDPAPCLVVTSE